MSKLVILVGSVICADGTRPSSATAGVSATNAGARAPTSNAAKAAFLVHTKPIVRPPMLVIPLAGRRAGQPRPGCKPGHHMTANIAGVRENAPPRQSVGEVS